MRKIERKQLVPVVATRKRFLARTTKQDEISSREKVERLFSAIIEFSTSSSNFGGNFDLESREKKKKHLWNNLEKLAPEMFLVLRRLWSLPTTAGGCSVVATVARTRQINSQSTGHRQPGSFASFYRSPKIDLMKTELFKNQSPSFQRTNFARFKGFCSTEQVQE